jgi:hypothetical protein
MHTPNTPSMPIQQKGYKSCTEYNPIQNYGPAWMY